MKALFVESQGKVVVTEVARPEPAEGEILIKVCAVALNPADWKMVDFMGQPGTIAGFDAAGVVVQGDSKFKVGQRVAAFVGGFEQDVGAFAEYVKVDSNLAWRVPDSIDFEEAAALDGAADTVMQHLYLMRDFPWPGEGVRKDEPFLVWSAATSVGMYFVQLAKLAGCTVVATASPKNWDLLKSLGAGNCYAYSDADTPSKISSKYPTLAHAVDCVATGGSTKQVSLSLGQQGGLVTSLGMPQPDDNAGRADVKVVGGTGFALLGKSRVFGGQELPTSQRDYEGAIKWAAIKSELVESGKLKANPLSRQSGGLEAIGEGLQMLRENKVSAQKLTYAIA